LTTPAESGSAPLTTLGEHGLISRIRDRFPAPPGLLTVPIGDDAAVAPPVRGALEVLTTDALVEGMHFDLAFCSPADVGYRALAVNLSDVAAMGGTPRLALLSLVLPPALTVADIDGLLDGFAEMAAEARVTLAGGNITASPGPLVVDVSLTGWVKPRKVLTRAGGRPGDALYVTGSIGDAAAGLGWLRARAGDGSLPDAATMADAVARYRRPSPRLRLGALLGRTRTASACMDLSDGLADAVVQLARASGTGARLDAAALPVGPGALRWFTSQAADPIVAALRGGDDYELLFSVAPRRRRRLRGAIEQARGLRVTRIGELTSEPDTVLVRDGRTEPLPTGFTHF
jgi:thiamine-monophosphate kinase